MECFTRYLWPRLWRFKVLLFLSLVFLLNASKLASEVPRLSTTITTLAAASFSGSDGTTSLIIITLCSHFVEGATPRSMDRTVCWRSSDTSFGVQITKENTSVLLGEDVLCCIFLCWGNRSSSSSQMAPSMTAAGISFSAIATDHNDSFHCGMEEGNFSAIFCWGEEFGDGKFLPSVALPGFCSLATARGMLEPWQRVGSADITASSSLGEPALPASTRKRRSLSTAAPTPLLLPSPLAHPRRTKFLISIGVGIVFACLLIAALMYLAWLYCFKKVPSIEEYEPAVDFEYTDEEEGGAAGAQEQNVQEDESEGEDIEVFLAERAAQRRRAAEQALADAEAGAQVTATAGLGEGQAAVNQAVACADAQ